LFATCVVDTGGKFAAVSLTPVANLLLVSTIPAELVEKFAAIIVDTGGKFATSVQNDPSNIFRGLGEDDS
jgi:hypothetical protein